MKKFLELFFSLFKPKTKPAPKVVKPPVKPPIVAPPKEEPALPLPPPKPQAAVITAAVVAVAVAASVLMSGGPARIYGVTLTDPWGANLTKSIEAMKAMKYRPTARIVYDESGMSANDFASAASKVHKVADVMAEVLDSFFVKKVTVQQYGQRVKDLLNTGGDNIDWIECGNEINGNWLGPAADVAAKVAECYRISKAAGKKVVLTLYLDCPNDCTDKAHYMLPWAKANIPEEIKLGLDMVLVSYYEDDQQNWNPDWQKEIDSIGAIFPNSLLGVGEMGTTKKDKKAALIKKYYNDLKVDHRRWIMGNFDWYADTGDWQLLIEAINANP